MIITLTCDFEFFLILREVLLGRFRNACVPLLQSDDQSEHRPNKQVQY